MKTYDKIEPGAPVMTPAGFAVVLYLKDDIGHAPDWWVLEVDVDAGLGTSHSLFRRWYAEENLTLLGPVPRIDLGEESQQSQPDKAQTPFSVEPGYERLAAVFQDAHDHASLGKGKERHANGEPFHNQRMQKVSRTLGSPYGMAFQVGKKMLEGLEMTDRGACRRELLGALNYLAGIVIYLDDQEAAGLAANDSTNRRELNQ